MVLGVINDFFSLQVQDEINKWGNLKVRIPLNDWLRKTPLQKWYRISVNYGISLKRNLMLFDGYLSDFTLRTESIDIEAYNWIHYLQYRLLDRSKKYQATPIKTIVSEIFEMIKEKGQLPFSLGDNNCDKVIAKEFAQGTSFFDVLRGLNEENPDLIFRIITKNGENLLEVGEKIGDVLQGVRECDTSDPWRTNIVNRERKDSMDEFRNSQGTLRNDEHLRQTGLLFERALEDKTPAQLPKSTPLPAITISRDTDWWDFNVGDRKSIRLITGYERLSLSYTGLIQERRIIIGAWGLKSEIKVAQNYREDVNVLDTIIKNLRKSSAPQVSAPQVDLSWYATSSAVNQAIQSQNTKIEKKADSSFVQWVAQTAQTALNTANEAKQTAESKANKSDVVHKSWSETIDWGKTFSGWLALRDNKIYLRGHWDNNHFIKFDAWAWNGADWVRIHEIWGFTFSTNEWDVFKITAPGNLKFGKTEADIEVKDLTLWKHNPRETQTISQYAKATNWTSWGIHFVDYVAATPNWLTNWGKELRGYLHIGDWIRTFDKFQVRWYEWFDWTEASLANARKYIKLDAPKILLWDEDILWEWKTYTPTVSANWSPTITESFWKYQKIWKTVHCKVKLRVRRNWSYWRFFVSLPVNARDTWEIVDGTSVVWTFWASNSNNYGYITVSNWHAQILWGIWHAGNFGNLAEDVFISFSITYEAI